jgi:hypothetical protein
LQLLRRIRRERAAARAHGASRSTDGIAPRRHAGQPLGVTMKVDRLGRPLRVAIRLP